MNVFKMAIAGIVFLCSNLNLIAQEAASIPKTKKMKYGIGMGLNYSNYHSTFTYQGESRPSVEGFDPILGFSILCSAERTLSSRLKATLRPEIAFLGANSEDYDFRYNNVNIVIPISAHVRLVDQLYIHGGAAIEYLAGISTEPNGNAEVLKELINNRWLPSMHTGISYVVSDWVDIGIKYNYGLQSFFEFVDTDINGETRGSLNYKNSYLQLAVIIRQ